MSRAKVLLTVLLFGIGCMCYSYYYHTPLISPSSKTIRSALTLPAFSLPPSKYKVVTMNDRTPAYKLATIDGSKPYADGDRSQATVITTLQLHHRCQQDPALIVVDVGAFLGDFGLYAAACGCQVFILEVQPDMVDLIRTSIALNNFSTSRVHIIQKAVNDLPSNSNLTFASQGGQTNAGSGTLRVSTIRLDDVEWPVGSSIVLLKVDVEGFELNVLRSGEKLFRAHRVQHVIFEYTAWWTDRAAQKDLIPYVETTLGAKELYALDRTGVGVYGPLSRDVLNGFHASHVQRHLQTDVYARFAEWEGSGSLPAQRYVMGSSFA